MSSASTTTTPIHTDDALTEPKGKKKKKTKWTTLTLAGYSLPVIAFEDHPFAKQCMAESAEKTLQEREHDISKREQQMTKREVWVSHQEEAIRRFRRLELGLGRGRGAGKEWRKMIFEDAEGGKKPGGNACVCDIVRE